MAHTDTERLDWIVKQDARVINAAAEIGGLESGFFLFWGDTEDDGEWQTKRHPTARDAIDSAMDAGIGM